MNVHTACTHGGAPRQRAPPSDTLKGRALENDKSLIGCPNAPLRPALRLPRPPPPPRGARPVRGSPTSAPGGWRLGEGWRLGRWQLVKPVATLRRKCSARDRTLTSQRADQAPSAPAEEACPGSAASDTTAHTRSLPLSSPLARRRPSGLQQSALTYAPCSCECDERPHKQ